MKNNKNIYQAPELTFVTIEAENILSLSPNTPDNENFGMEFTF